MFSDQKGFQVEPHQEAIIKKKSYLRISLPGYLFTSTSLPEPAHTYLTYRSVMDSSVRTEVENTFKEESDATLILEMFK